MNLVFRIAIAVIAIPASIAVTPAAAGPNLNCKGYALVAVAQQKENLNSKCGFKGGRWSLNYTGHFNWCRIPGVTISHISLEDAARKNALRACKQKLTTKGGESFKVKYCKKAATASQGWRQAVEQACKGIKIKQEWPGGWQGDFNTCLTKGGSWADLLNAKRKKQASACTIQKRTKTFTNKDKLRKKTRYGWLSYDTCSNKGKYGKSGENLWNSCGRGWANELCKRFGYNKVTKIGKPQPNDQRAGWGSVKADGPSTWWVKSGKICRGKCYYFTSITCTK